MKRQRTTLFFMLITLALLGRAAQQQQSTLKRLNAAIARLQPPAIKAGQVWRKKVNVDNPFLEPKTVFWRIVTVHAGCVVYIHEPGSYTATTYVDEVSKQAQLLK